MNEMPFPPFGWFAAAAPPASSSAAVAAAAKARVAAMESEGKIKET